jgi:hypothetical protein
MQAETVQAADLGFRLAVNGYIGRDSPVEQAALDHNLSLIDTYPWGRIEAACGPALLSQTCSLTEAQLQEIEQEIRAHLQVTRKDDSVVGYWVLDDDPGDVRPALDLIHRLIQEDALSGRNARPTICGFGGNLDSATNPGANSRAAFDTAVGNFTVTGCDAVALYPYAPVGAPDQAADLDWSMGSLLPYMLDGLRAHGWDPTQQPLIGIPQAFASVDRVMPTDLDISTQTAAYCAAGATTILFYAWNDSLQAPKFELFNSATLRSGVVSGMAACAGIWASS